MRSIAHLYFLFARDYRRARGSKGQDSSDCSVIELGCRVSNTQFTESPLGIILKGCK